MARVYMTIDQYESAEPYETHVSQRILKGSEWDDELFDEVYDLSEEEQDDIDE